VFGPDPLATRRSAGAVSRPKEEKRDRRLRTERRSYHTRSALGRLCHAGPMILEHALLPVKPGEESRFEAAFAEAKAFIVSVPGFGRLSLSRCLERPDTYLLLVEWASLEDHTVGFRESSQYEEWRRR
jgi:heme-degrading monooxygenase HmoA